MVLEMKINLFFIPAHLSKIILTAISFAVFSGAVLAQAPCGAQDYDCQIAAATRVISANPNAAEGYMKRGDAYYNKGDYAPSIDDYSKVLELKPDNAQIYAYRADAYYHSKRYNEAINDFTKAIELGSADAETYINRGNAYDTAGNFDAAMKDYNQAIKLDSGSASAYYNRGIAQLFKDKNKEAIADFQKALQINPDYASAKEYLAKAQTGKQEKDERRKAKWAAFGQAVDQIPTENNAPSNGRSNQNVGESVNSQTTVANRASGEFNVGDRVNVTKSGLEGAENLQPCTITKGLVDRSYEVRCDPHGGLPYMDYKVFSRWVYPWANASAAPQFDCSFDAPAGTSADDAAPSAQLFKRVIYERLTAAEKASMGLQFTTFQMGTPFKNVMTGRGLLKDAVPEDAMFYPIKTQYTTCKEGGGDYNYRRVTKENFGCYKNRFGEWMCGTDSTPEFLEQQDVPKDQ